ncbi:MAG TPA: leucine-rich repeat protein, partial [Bacilli bacterium]|nr:leucine-rich repeat protein [Bacilli bacterium]
MIFKRKNSNPSQQNNNYKQGLKYELGVDVYKDYRKALQYYRQGAQEGDYLSSQKVKYSRLSKLHLIINLIIMAVAIFLGIYYNKGWLSYFIIGLTWVVIATIDFPRYWHKRSVAYIVNTAMLLISLTFLLPFSAIIPYLNGITYVPMVVLLAIAVFFSIAGIILFIDKREVSNAVVAIIGLTVTAFSVISFNIETPEKKFTYTEIEGGIEITHYRSSKPVVEVPRKINNLPVISIGSSAFAGSGVTHITVHDNIKIIKSFAFANNPSLVEVILPAEVEIEEGLFYNDSELASIVLPESLTQIPNYMFYGATKLQTIDIPSNVKSIGAYAFADAVNLKEVKLPDGLLLISHYAFANNRSLKKIALPESIVSLGQGVFSGASALGEVNIPVNIDKIPNYMFENNQALTEFEIPTYIK